MTVSLRNSSTGSSRVISSSSRSSRPSRRFLWFQPSSSSTTTITRTQRVVLLSLAVCTVLISWNFLKLFQLNAFDTSTHHSSRTQFVLADFIIASSHNNKHPQRSTTTTTTPFTRPTKPLAQQQQKAGARRSYNGLDIIGLTKAHFQRSIHKDDVDVYEKERSDLLDSMQYGERSRYYHDEEQDRPLECERTNWRSSLYVNCNSFHEMDAIEEEAYRRTFLGRGYYRYAWLMTSNHTGKDSFVMKQMRLPEDDNDGAHLPSSSSFLKIHNEAIIMERLTSAPSIVDIYGHCGTSILAETMPGEVTTDIVPLPGYIDQSDLDKKPTLCQNNLTIQEKLEIAIVMAESMAEIHGFVGGVMVHGDIHPDQYLRSKDGKVKLNDFNNAEILDWNVKQNNQYCLTDRGQWGGMYRSPEEFRGDPIDEQIDVYSLGNNFYTLLTGLWPFYEDIPYRVVQEKIHKKERPFIDERYRNGHKVEQELIKWMELCWKHRPKDRPSVFQVLEALRKIKIDS